jgi:mono/diheme cytochrome c family protein
MKKLLISLVLIVSAAPTLVLADGRTDYNAYCAGCHGAHGNVQTEKARALKMDVRKLALKVSKMNKAEMIAIIEEGRNHMPGFKDTIAKDRIAGIVDYVIALRKK